MTTITLDVELDLSQFNTQDLIEELEQRGCKVPGAGLLSDDEAREQLERIHHLMRMKQPKQAYKLMYNYVRDALGTAI